MLRKLLQFFRGKPKKPADPRLAADPWLGAVFAQLGERYQLGPDGAQVFRRTGRARFNAMPVWIEKRTVRGDYEVRGDPARAKSILDSRISGPLQELGLAAVNDSIEEWAGTVLTRRYEGLCDTAGQAAAAVKFLCEDSELQINVAAEPT